jgi:hypothetical protein
VAKPDPSLLDGAVAPAVLDAMRTASRALTALGIRHVSANGHLSATRVIDFLVGDEAFEHHPGGFVSMKPGVPIQVNGVAIDLLFVQTGEDHLASALEAPMGSIIEAPQLVYLKLKSPRLKDRADIIELIKAGIDVQGCRAYLRAHAPGLTGAFEDAVARAAAEE